MVVVAAMVDVVVEMGILVIEAQMVVEESNLLSGKVAKAAAQEVAGRPAVVETLGATSGVGAVEAGMAAMMVVMAPTVAVMEILAQLTALRVDAMAAVC